MIHEFRSNGVHWVLLFFYPFNLSQLINKLLYEGYVKALSQEFEYLFEHVQERWGKLFKVQLQAQKDWP